ncbi:MAG: hypothetical protein E7163_04415 [Firmicutes bacterium]|nr:hypothetical protein [Bacillota bacterium]
MYTYYDFHKNKYKPKEIDEIDLNLLNSADMNSYVLSTIDTPIIGTYGLGPCVGLLFEDDINNSCLGHIAADYEQIIINMFSEMKSNNIKITLVPGSFTTLRKINAIRNYIHTFPFNIDYELKDLGSYLNKECEGIEFAYDTRTKKFIKPDFDKYIEMKRGR